MNENELFDALKRIVNKELLLKIKDNIVIQDGDGGYILFDTYLIVKKDMIWAVIRISDDERHDFTSLRNAVAWATMDKKCNISEARRIDFLDLSLGGIDFSIELYKKLYNKAKDKEKRMLYLNKLQANIYKRKDVSEELSSIVDRIKRQQVDRFHQNLSTK